MLPEVNKAFRDPFKRLAKKASHPQVMWVAQYFLALNEAYRREDYRREAEALLKALPMTMDELRAYGERNNFTGLSVWDTLVREADATGLFRPLTQDEAVELAETPAQPEPQNAAERRAAWIERNVPADYRRIARNVLRDDVTAERVRDELRHTGHNSPVALNLVDQAVRDGVLPA